MSTDYYIEKLKSILDGTIVGLHRDGNEYEEYYGLVINGNDGVRYILTLLSDDEGNAPGSFDLYIDKE